MSAVILILPVIRVERFEADAIEQGNREAFARTADTVRRPPRTRPLLVHCERISVRHYNHMLRRVSAALNDNND